MPSQDIRVVSASCCEVEKGIRGNGIGVLVSILSGSGKEFYGVASPREQLDLENTSFGDGVLSHSPLTTPPPTQLPAAS